MITCEKCKERFVAPIFLLFHTCDKEGGDMEELTIKKERVLKAAEGCDDAREVLETLFPEAFEKPGFDLTKLAINERARMDQYENIFRNPRPAASGFHQGLCISVSAEGKYKDKAFVLDGDYTWTLAHDEAFEDYYLIPGYKP